MSGVEIRQADPDDAAEIAAIHIRSFLASYPHLPITRRSAENGLSRRVEMWADRLSGGDRRTIVAVEGGKVIGFVHVGASPDENSGSAGHIYSVHVDPQMTSRGIGAALVDEARATLSRDGYRTATLWAVAGNVRVRRFYERLGWRRDGARRRERLAVGEEEGDDVEVIRYRVQLDETAEEA